MGAYHKPYEEAEIRMKLEPIAKMIAKSENGIEKKEVQRMLRGVQSNLTTLTMYFPIYEEIRAVCKNRTMCFIFMLKK